MTRDEEVAAVADPGLAYAVASGATGVEMGYKTTGAGDIRFDRCGGHGCRFVLRRHGGGHRPRKQPCDAVPGDGSADD